jgi:hypothetical protein
MRQFFRNLLILLTALMLGLSPLRSSALTFSDTTDSQGSALHVNPTLAGDFGASPDLAAGPACDQCKVDDDCFNPDCSSSHCSSCATVLTRVNPHSMYFAALPMLSPVDEGIPRLLASSLFRPPRH